MKKRKDSLTKAQRSYCMSKIRSKDTKVEMLVRKELFKEGLRFRKHVKNLPGNPDLVFPSSKLIIFIDGDFWHGKNFNKWKHKLSPTWHQKIYQNKLRDRRNSRRLKKLGWTVIRIWESDVYVSLESEIFKIIILKKLLEYRAEAKKSALLAPSLKIA